jgi:hypothetical protein
MEKIRIRIRDGKNSDPISATLLSVHPYFELGIRIHPDLLLSGSVADPDPYFLV